MKAHIYKPEEETKIYICVEAENLLEELAIDAIREKQRRGYITVVISVAGLGEFYPLEYKPEVEGNEVRP
jgi:hypothetical protein